MERRRLIDLLIEDRARRISTPYGVLVAEAQEVLAIELGLSNGDIEHRDEHGRLIREDHRAAAEAALKRWALR